MSKNRSGTMTAHNNESIAKFIRSLGFFAQVKADIGSNIFGRDLYAGVLCREIPQYPQDLIIEYRSQEVSGTADEKLTFLVLNILHKYPAPVVLILEGQGFREGAIDWVETCVGDKLIKVFTTFEQFKYWFKAQVKQ